MHPVFYTAPTCCGDIILLSSGNWQQHFFKIHLNKIGHKSFLLHHNAWNKQCKGDIPHILYIQKCNFGCAHTWGIHEHMLQTSWHTCQRSSYRVSMLGGSHDTMAWSGMSWTSRRTHQGVHLIHWTHQPTSSGIHSQLRWKAQQFVQEGYELWCPVIGKVVNEWFKYSWKHAVVGAHFSNWQQQFSLWHSLQLKMRVLNTL